jgi:hypothetical protein
MTPEALSLVFFILEEAIKEEPAIAAALKDLFSKADPTPADWAALRLKVASKSYEDYVPESALTLPLPPAVAQESVMAALTPAAAPAPAAQVFTGQATDPHAAA